MVSKDEGEVIEKGIISLKRKKKMISNDVQGKEDQRFISLLSKFPKLFIDDYSQIIRREGIKHHVKLKESVRIAQKLRQLEIVQKEDPIIEDCVSPIVVVSKKNDIDFENLNDSTKRDQFSLPFRDEILDEIVVYTRQGNVKNVMCQEGIHVDATKIEVIQKGICAKSSLA